MAKHTFTRIGFGTAIVIAAGWLACASEAPQDAELPRIPQAQRAVDPAPGDALSVASLSEGGLLEPGLEAGQAPVELAKLDQEIPAEVLSYLSGGLSDDGSLQLGPEAGAPQGIPISMTAGASLLGDEFDFPTPSLNPPAAPAPTFD